MRDARESLVEPVKMWTIATAVAQHCEDGVAGADADADTGAGAGAGAGLVFCVLELVGSILGTTYVVARQEGLETKHRTRSATPWSTGRPPLHQRRYHRGLEGASLPRKKEAAMPPTACQQLLARSKERSVRTGALGRKI